MFCMYLIYISIFNIICILFILTYINLFHLLKFFFNDYKVVALYIYRERESEREREREPILLMDILGCSKHVLNIYVYVHLDVSVVNC